MKVIDTSAINFVMSNNLDLEGVFYVTPDILDEIYTLEIGLGKSAPHKNLINIFEDESFSQASYLKNYYDIFNSVGGKSLYTMRGLGDVSIMALAKTILEENSVPRIPFIEHADKHVFYTGDKKLEKRLTKITGLEIEILSSESLQ